MAKEFSESPKQWQRVSLSRPTKLTVSLTLADQMLISSTSCFTIIFTYILSWKFLNERIACVDLFSIFLLVTGTCIAILFSNFEPKTYNIVVSFRFYLEGTRRTLLLTIIDNICRCLLSPCNLLLVLLSKVPLSLNPLRILIQIKEAYKRQKFVVTPRSDTASQLNFSMMSKESDMEGAN